MKPAPHGQHAIPRGTDGGPNGDARGGDGRGAIVAGESAAPGLRELSRALAGGVVAFGADRAQKPLGIHYSDAPTKVLVVGGGFGGLAAVRELARAFGGSRDVGVALMDRVNYTPSGRWFRRPSRGTSRCAT